MLSVNMQKYIIKVVEKVDVKLSFNLKETVERAFFSK